MTTSSTFAIVGGGLAGAKAAEALRDKDFDGHVVLFAAEQHLPYERPPLSKEYLAGKKELGDFTTASSAWYRDHHIELQLGTEVSAIDPDTHTVSLPDGSAVRYDKLGVNDALLLLQITYEHKRLVAPEQFLALLDRVTKNESYVHIARERAASLAESIRKPSAPPQEKTQP